MLEKIAIVVAVALLGIVAIYKLATWILADAMEPKNTHPFDLLAELQALEETL
jgi:hypothetical protein